MGVDTICTDPVLKQTNKKTKTTSSIIISPLPSSRIASIKLKLVTASGFHANLSPNSITVPILCRLSAAQNSVPLLCRTRPSSQPCLRCGPQTLPPPPPTHSPHSPSRTPIPTSSSRQLVMKKCEWMAEIWMKNLGKFP